MKWNATPWVDAYNTVASKLEAIQRTKKKDEDKSDSESDLSDFQLEIIPKAKKHKKSKSIRKISVVSEISHKKQEKKERKSRKREPSTESIASRVHERYHHQ